MSNIINFAGLYFIICLQSSDPIDPPPPVTNTFFPLNIVFIYINKAYTKINKTCISSFLP